jgi:ligand-binding SRPBCC domain-containing protein
VSASAIGFYGDRGDERLDESSSPGTGFLADVCREWESEAAAAAEHGVRVVVVRIGVVLGPDGGALEKMLPLFRLGAGGRLGAGDQWMSWIHVDDVVSMLAFAVERSDVRGTLNAVAPAPVRNRDFTGALASALGRPAWLPVPAVALRLLAGEMSVVLLGSQRVEPAAASRLGFSFAHPELGGALADLCRDPSHLVEREQLVRRPRDQVFPFFSDARNLERITPEFLRFRVKNMSTPEIGQGTLIDYRLSLHGLPVGWRSRIEEWRPDERFVDVQLRGPYSFWHHTHEFEPVPEGTIVRDRIRYRLPFGALGDLVAGSFVARDVDRIFAHRRACIDDLLGRPR